MRLFSNLSDEKSPAETSSTEGKMHQDTTTQKHKKHHLKNQNLNSEKHTC